MDDPSVLELVGEARILELVGAQVATRVAESVRNGRFTDQAAAITRLFKGTASARISTLAFELAGGAAAAWEAGSTTSGVAVGYLIRQAGCIGGGTVEMARNVISERVLGMPRERAVDRDVAFRDVPRSRQG